MCVTPLQHRLSELQMGCRKQQNIQAYSSCICFTFRFPLLQLWAQETPTRKHYSLPSAVLYTGMFSYLVTSCTHPKSIFISLSHNLLTY